ncbi:MAG: hypothetical protein JSV53_12035 [candidate division WOR-3 bacterium]|nr:MAG: hypothetical protein JSV53_12035 [candidate division WOR-3 bacterium]
MLWGFRSGRFFSNRWIAAFVCCFGSLLGTWFGCVQYTKYVPNPEKDIDQWVANFARQRSFSYRYEAKLRFVRVDATGYCVIGEGENVSGTWYGQAGEQDFEYVGLGDVEYLRKGSDWERISRGEESDIFTQIKRILITDKFEYEGSAEGYTYRFKANIPFLSPERRKEMVGLVTISPKNFLPDFIWAGLPDSSTYWTAQLFGYNSNKSIKSPVKEKREYLIKPNSESRVDYGSLEKRLDILSVDYRLEKNDEGFLLRLPLHYAIEDAGAMLRPGGMVVYAVAEKQQEATKTGYLMGDVYKPLFLTKILLTERDIREVKIDFDGSSAPYISLKLRQKSTLPRMVAIEVDSLLVATATLDTLRKSDRINLYPEMQYNEMEILRAYILQPLGGLEVKSYGGEFR